MPCSSSAATCPRLVAPREDRRVDPRVERLDAAAEHLGRPGQLLDARDSRPRLLERVGGAAAGDQLDAEVGEPACEVLEPVRDNLWLGSR